MSKTDIDKTFSAIRQAPLEVDFEQIRQFVLQQPVQSTGDTFSLRSWLNFTNMLMATITISTLAAILLITSPQPVKVNTPIKTPTPAVQQQTTTTQTPEKKSIPEKKKKNLSTKEDDPAKEFKPVIFSDVKKTASLLHPAGRANKNTVETNGQSSSKDFALENQETDTTPIRIRTYTSNYCTFDGEDAWIKAFLKALISEHIIKDSVNLQFTFSLNSFVVNGEAQNPDLVLRFNELYSSITHELLNSRSQISLSVGGSSCTLSKVIDD